MDKSHTVVCQEGLVTVFLHETADIVRKIVRAIVVDSALFVHDTIFLKLGFRILIALEREMVETVVVEAKQFRQLTVFAQLPFTGDTGLIARLFG